MSVKAVVWGCLSVLLLQGCKEAGVETASEASAAEISAKASPAMNAPLEGGEFYRGASIYEVNVRQYSEEGSLAAVTRDIPRLKALGVDILWLMPIQPIGEKKRKGELGSYYSIADYTAVNPEYGSLDDLKTLVETAHQHGQKVILDWVANHTAWDHPWIESHADWYTHDGDGNITDPIDDQGKPWGWTDVADLNYDNRALWQGMTDAMKFWLVEANIDGFRCDVAGEVPTEFWNFARPQLDQVKPVFMLAEAEKPELQKAFDMSYGWEFHHLTNDIAKGEKPASVVHDYIVDRINRFDADHLSMMFTTNHDENSWNGTVFERYGDAHRAMAVLTFTVDGMPLIYSGQEASMTKRLKFFEKDAIDWGDYELQEFYASLLSLKKSTPALWSGAEGGRYRPLSHTSENDRVLGFQRSHNLGRVDVWINFSDTAVTVEPETLPTSDRVLWGQATIIDGAFVLQPYQSVIFGSKAELADL